MHRADVDGAVEDLHRPRPLVGGAPGAAGDDLGPVGVAHRVADVAAPDLEAGAVRRARVQPAAERGERENVVVRGSSVGKSMTFFQLIGSAGSALAQAPAFTLLPISAGPHPDVELAVMDQERAALAAHRRRSVDRRPVTPSVERIMSGCWSGEPQPTGRRVQSPHAVRVGHHGHTAKAEDRGGRVYGRAGQVRGDRRRLEDPLPRAAAKRQISARESSLKASNPATSVTLAPSALRNVLTDGGCGGLPGIMPPGSSTPRRRPSARSSAT